MSKIPDRHISRATNYVVWPTCGQHACHVRNVMRTTRQAFACDMIDEWPSRPHTAEKPPHCHQIQRQLTYYTVLPRCLSEPLTYQVSQTTQRAADNSDLLTQPWPTAFYSGMQAQMQRILTPCVVNAQSFFSAVLIFPSTGTDYDGSSSRQIYGPAYKSTPDFWWQKMPKIFRLIRGIYSIRLQPIWYIKQNKKSTKSITGYIMTSVFRYSYH